MTTTLLRERTTNTETTPAASTMTGSALHRLDGIVIGRFVGFDQTGRPLVSFKEADSEALVARAATVLAVEHVGRDVAILCESGNPAQPIIVGLMHRTEINAGHEEDAAGSCEETDLDLTAKRQITLRCGKASITLTRAGKIIVRGTYLLSRSSGVNKIKGGSIQLN
jgi:hypothetical protein